MRNTVMNTPKLLTKAALIGATALVLDLGFATLATSAAQAENSPSPVLSKTTDVRAASNRVITSVSPFHLVHLAHQGHLQTTGIPSGNALIHGYIRGTITPQDIAEAAVQDHRLPESTLADAAYLRNVGHHLDDITKTGSGD